MSQTRDYGINYCRARKDYKCYGMGLGVMLMDEVYPGFPGDIRNASGFPFHIQYEIVKGVDINKLVYSEDKSSCHEPIQAAALKLEKMGCLAITAECGYFYYFQREVSESVNVPVFLSCLLQVPLAKQVIGPNELVGIIGVVESLANQDLEVVGIKPGSNYVTYTCHEQVEGCEEFDHLWIPGRQTDPPTAYYDKAENEFITVATDFYKKYPNMGAMVLNCTGMQSFARALQREIDIPIFSWGTLLHYAYSVVVHREYYGHV